MASEGFGGFGYKLFVTLFALASFTMDMTARGDTGDVLDEALPENTGVWVCNGSAVVTWADIDEDGVWDTQLVFNTVEGAGGDAGEAQITSDDPDGKWYFYSFIDSHCGGAAPYVGRGRFAIHFVDILADGFVWNDQDSWTYKSVPAVSLRTSYDGCYGYEDPRYDEGYMPYSRVQAYAERLQTDPIAPHDETVIGGWRNYRFTNPGGIKELYVNTDFCENVLDDLVLYDHQLIDHIAGGRAGLVLLFDTSGSMDWSHDATVGVPDDEKRLTLAKDAAIPIVHLMNDHGEGNVDFAITRFPLQPWESGTCNAQIITPMTTVDDGSTTTAVDTTIPGLTATGTTPLLTGLATALTTFGGQDTRAVVLLSDGYHNCPHTVDAVDPEVTTAIADALAAEAKVFTIGFGRPADVDHPLLEALASGTDGEFYDVTEATFDPATWVPETALQEAYVAILSGALALDMGTDPRGVIKAGQTISREMPVSALDRTVSFYLSWATRQAGQLGLTVYSSDGAPVPEGDDGVVVHQGLTYKIVTVKQAFLEQAGKVGATPWRLEIDAQQLANVPEEHYQYSVLISSDLKMQAAVSEQLLFAGQPVTVTAKLSNKGQPLTGLDQVEAIVTRPQDGLGNWFAANQVSADELAQIPAKVGDEIIPDVSRKFRFLRDIRKVALPGRTEPATLKLYDDGSHGDAAANDGVYTNRYTDTVKEGTYGFLVRARGETAQGSFQREARIDRYVGLLLAEGSVAVDLTTIPSDLKDIEKVSVRVTPKDALGNHLGPRHAASVQVKPSWGRLSGAIQDNLDGSYSQIVEVPAGLKQTLDIAVTVGEAQGSISWESPTAPDEWPFTWIILLAIIVLIVLMMMRMRTR